MNFVQDTNVSEEVLLGDDDTLIVSTKKDKLKAISLETATIVTEFEGFLAPFYEVRAINGGKGQQHIHVVRMLNEIVTILPLSTPGTKGHESASGHSLSIICVFFTLQTYSLLPLGQANLVQITLLSREFSPIKVKYLTRFEKKRNHIGYQYVN